MKVILTLNQWAGKAIRTPFVHFVQVLALLVPLTLVTACSDLMVWKEEVKLSDGRVVEITQKHRCTGRCVTREAWVTVRLPETGNNEVTWHEGLKPTILNVYSGKAYIVAKPQTSYAWRVYGKPEPYFLTYRWEGGHWRLVPLEELPKAVYDTNLLIDPGLLKGNFLSLADKESAAFNGDPRYQVTPYQLRVDPTHQSVFAETAKTEACTWDATNTVCSQNKSREN